MRFSLCFLAATAGIAMAQFLPCETNTDLADCVIAPLSTICTGGDLQAQETCACSELAYQSHCYMSYCGTYPAQYATAYSTLCTNGMFGGIGALPTDIPSVPTDSLATAAITPAGTEAGALNTGSAGGAVETSSAGGATAGGLGGGLTTRAGGATATGVGGGITIGLKVTPTPTPSKNGAMALAPVGGALAGVVGILAWL